jgi:hypothetical protein
MLIDSVSVELKQNLQNLVAGTMDPEREVAAASLYNS